MAFAAQVEQWRGLVAARWPANEIDNALAVINCESGGDPNAWNTNNEDSRGLAQINLQAHPQWAGYNLFDPVTNLDLAFQLWREQGWGPWTCARNIAVTGADMAPPQGFGLGGAIMLGIAVYVLYRMLS